MIKVKWMYWIHKNILFHAGDFISKYYFPIFVPIGVTGNILSFLVSFVRTIHVNFYFSCVIFHPKDISDNSLFQGKIHSLFN